MRDRRHRIILDLAVGCGQDLVPLATRLQQVSVATGAAHSQRVPAPGLGEFALPPPDHRLHLVGRLWGARASAAIARRTPAQVDYVKQASIESGVPIVLGGSYYLEQLTLDLEAGVYHALYALEPAV